MSTGPAQYPKDIIDTDRGEPETIQKIKDLEEGLRAGTISKEDFEREKQRLQTLKNDE